MKISLKLIATYRELLPAESPRTTIELDVPEGATAQAVLAQFNVPTGDASVVLVNGRVPEDGQILRDGDTVHAFPALAGG
jgi:molybdopterin converting factor small subunit